MTDTYSDTRVVSILDRRKQLKQQRRSQFFQAVWRTFAIASGMVAMGWLFSRPEWKIHQASQIQILGNQQISTQTLEAFVPIAFPTSLLRIRPNVIKTSLEKNTHIETVSITRQLFPPHILIQVQERSPVAFTSCKQCLLITYLADAQPVTLGPSDLWLLDEQGVPLPYESYPSLRQTGKMPALSITHYFKPLDPTKIQQSQINLSKTQAIPVEVDVTLQKNWHRIFQVVRSSPVKVQELDWQDSKNLKLNTEFGVVQLGPMSSKLTEQLQKLDTMRSLPQLIDLKKIKFINLENPKHPIIELHQAIKPSSPQNLP